MKINFFLKLFFFFFFFSLACTLHSQAQEVRKLTNKKWKFDLIALTKDLKKSIYTLDSLVNKADESEKMELQNLRNGMESMWSFIPNLGNTTFEFKRNGELVIIWEGNQISKGRWTLAGKILTMQLGDDVEDVIIINKLTDNQLVATTENDSSLRLISME
jgi:hypothetical protein